MRVDVLLGMQLGLLDWWLYARALFDAAGVLVKPAAISLVILVLTLPISRVSSARLRRELERGTVGTNVAILLARALWIAVWAFAIFLVLGQFGVGFTPLAASIGVLGLAASLSLQQVLQNLVAGVYILAEHPFDLGDTILVVAPNGVNHEGTVEDVQMRTTHLRSRDDELILVPNSAIFTGVVTNRTAVGGYVTHVTITFPRDTDLDGVRETAFPLLTGLPSVLPAPQPQLRVDKVAEDHWTGSLSFWATSGQSPSDAIWALGRAFPNASVNETPPPAAS